MKTYNFYTIIISVFAFLIIILLVFPQYQNWKIASLRLTALKEDEKKQNEYFNNLRQIDRDLENYKDALDKIHTALPESSALPQLLNFIQKLASQNGLYFKKIGAIETKEATQAQLKETKIEIALSGDYQGFKRFVSGLERSARLIEIENINFSYPPETEKKQQEEQKKKKEEVTIFDFQLTIKVYHK